MEDEVKTTEPHSHPNREGHVHHDCETAGQIILDNVADSIHKDAATCRHDSWLFETHGDIHVCLSCGKHIHLDSEVVVQEEAA
jgi:hypothetical protein